MDRLQRLFPGGRKRISRFRQDHTYWIISDSSGQTSFGVVGSPGGRHPYNRLYLQDSRTMKADSHLYRGGAEVAGQLIQNRGLVVLSEIALSDELARQTLRVPNFVDLTIDLPDTEAAYVSSLPHSARDDLRRVRNAQFTYEVSHEASWADAYFQRYYQPAMRERHGDEAYIMPATEMAALVHQQRAEFVKLHHQGVCLAAMLAQPTEQRYAILRLGWLDGNPAYVRMGAMSALYRFAVKRAYSLQCPQVFLGGTPSYLENGVFRYKTKWGGRLAVPHPGYGCRHLWINPAHPDGYRFLEKNSLLAYGPDGSYNVLSSRNPDQSGLPDRFLAGIQRWYRLRSAPADDSLIEPDLPFSLQNWYESVPIEKTHVETESRPHWWG